MNDIDLVTGASGLVGGNLVRALAGRGRRVRILVRSQSRTQHLDDIPGLERVTGDITDPQSLRCAMQGVDTVYHCAARVQMGRSMNPATWNTNVTGVENILTGMQPAGARRLVFCSSVDAIGLSQGMYPSNEGVPWNWDGLGVETAYARSKYEAQQRVLAAARTGLDAVIVCPTYMFGPYDTHPSSGKMILSLAARRIPGFPAGGNNFVDVEDVVDGMIAAAQSGRSGEVYILGHQNLTYEEIFALICDVLGRPRLKHALPYPLARLAGWMGDGVEGFTGQESELNSRMIRLSYFYHYYDPRKAVRELGLRQTPVQHAIQKAVAWFRQSGMLTH